MLFQCGELKSATGVGVGSPSLLHGLDSTRKAQGHLHCHHGGFIENRFETHKDVPFEASQALASSIPIDTVSNIFPNTSISSPSASASVLMIAFRLAM